MTVLPDIMNMLNSLSPEKLTLLEKKLQQNGHLYNIFPLSFAQQRLWFLNQMEPEDTAYNLPSAVELKGCLNIPALEKSINEIISRHEVLRTAFRVIGNTPVQIIMPFCYNELQQTDLTIIRDEDKKNCAIRLITEENNCPFNLETGPLIKTRLYKLSDDTFILCILMHHIVADGWSVDVFINELQILYNSYSLNLTPELPQLSLQYADFSVWQRKWLEGEIMQKQLDFWKSKLEDIPAPFVLPGEQLKKKELKGRNSVFSVYLPAEDLTAAKKMCLNEGVTGFMLYLSVLQIALWRHTGQNDICIGTPVSGRIRSEIEPLIGFFVNTIVLRSRIDGKLSFKEYLSEVKKSALEAFSNQDLPFEKLAGEFKNAAADLNDSPLFRIMYIYQKAFPALEGFPDLTVTLVDINNESVKYDLNFSVIEDPNKGIQIALGYNSTIFPSGSIESLMEHYHTLLKDVVANPEKRLFELSVLSGQEINKILYEWNKTIAIPESGVKFFHQAFEEQVHKNPNSIAVVSLGKQLTFSELNKKANKLAHYLIKKGICPEKVAGVCTGRSVNLLVSVLGVMKAGGVYLPLDTLYPKNRLSFILEDSDAKVLICEEQLLSEIPEVSIEKIFIDKDWDKITCESEENPLVNLFAENAAYIIYTSGSTGKPKGTIIQHGSLYNLKLNLDYVYLKNFPSRALRIALNSTIMFDASVLHLLFITGGHCIYVVPDEIRRDPFELSKFIIEHNIDEVDSVPSVLKLLISEKLFENKLKPSIVLFGGEAIDEQTWKDLISFEGTEFYNSYGPTECTVAVTMCPVSKDNPKPSIGKPHSNVRIYILDNNFQAVPVGVEGEIFVGGISVGRGYLNRPDLTAEKFIPDLYGKEIGGRLYRTGDLGRYNYDGSIEFVGRTDQQVKVRGFRIETGEIEEVLLHYPEIKEAIVLLKENKGDKFLAAYLSARNGTKIDIENLKEFLGRELPYYMIPGFLMQLDSMPLLNSGKIDRKALPDPQNMDEASVTGFEAPLTPTEEIISEMMAMLLDKQRIGRKDNFFELGGHSLLATQLRSRISNSLKIDISLRTIFKYPAVETLAQIVDQAKQENLGLKSVQIKPFGMKEKVPLSYAQERLWFLEQLEPGSTNYNIPGAFQIKGKLNLSLLEKGINNIIARHEIFRMKITSEEGKAVQTLVEIDPFKVSFIDMRAFSKEGQEKEIKDQLLKEINLPFVLDKPPLLRIKLLQTDDESYFIIIVMHHIISDGWSVGIFMSELMSYYQANFEEERIIEENILRIQYSDYALWQRQQSQTIEYRNSMDYWKNKLKGSLSQIDLPKRKPGSTARSSKGKHISFLLEKELTSKLHLYCRAEEVTMFMFLLAAFKILLYKYSQQNDINIGTTIANRSIAETEDLIGFFVNTLVLRDIVDESLPFKAFLRNVKNTCLDAYAHQSIPFEKIVDEIQPVRNTSQSPLFQIMFILQNNKKMKVELPGLRISPVDFESEISLFDMTLVMEECDGGMMGAFEYSTDLFEDCIIEQMIVHFKKTIYEIVEQTYQNISVIPILTNEEISSLEKWGINSKKYESDLLIHTLFEDQVKRTPNIAAVISNEGSLSYNDLNRNANRIAHYLMSCGATPGMLIGISLDRSPMLISALLAVLKSGCAYVPLDSSFPSERINYIIERSGLGMIITQNDLEAKLSGFGKKVICVDLNDHKIKEQSEENVDLDISPASLAYVIFTSGSTGKPKGVMVRHESVVNHNRWISDAFQFTQDDKVLQFSTVNFDASVEEIFPSLQSGAAIVLRNKGVVPSVQETLDLIRKESVTILDITTAYWHELVNEIHSNRGVIPGSIRLTVVGGDKVNIEKYKLWLQIGGREVKFLNTYGPTETTIISSCYEVNEIAEMDDIPIGAPLSNTQLYVLDKNLQRMPPNASGELYIGGVGVSDGYIGQPDLTAEKFIPDPFADGYGKLMYKTGDKTRYTSAGELQFMGRLDNQVKLRGLRVEPGEIENALLQHPDISNAVITIRESNLGIRQLAAYYQLRDNCSLIKENSGQILRNYLKSLLPEYMIPAFIVRVDKFSFSPNGKIDTKVLPDPAIMISHEIDTPQNEKETKLLKAWKEVLGLEKISVLDNFFEIGGDSIMAIQVVAKSKRYGLSIEPMHIFQNQTIRQLALIASEAMDTKNIYEITPNQFGLTPIQIWFFEQNFPQQNYWNQSVAYELSDKADTSLLLEAVRKIFSHHEILHARFKKTEVWHCSYVIPGDEPILELVDYSHSENLQLKAEVERKIGMEQNSLNIESGPIIKFIYFRMPEAFSDILFIVAHHLVIDVVSWRILLEDLLEAYKSLLAGKAVILPEKTFPYSKWVEVLEEYAKQPERIKEIQYWLNQPYEKVSPIEADYNGEAELERDLETIVSLFETNTLLQEISKAEKNQNANTTDLLLTALVRTFSSWIGKRAFLIDLEGHGREQLENNLDLSRTIGWFTCIYPVILDLKDSIDSVSSLQEIKKQLHMVPNHGIGFGVLKYLSADEEISAKFRKIPESQICFNYLGKFKGLSNAEEKSISMGALKVNDRGQMNQLNNKLSITASITERGLQVIWSYSNKVFRKDTIQRLAEIFSGEFKLLLERSNIEMSHQYIASDFPIAGIDQKKLDKILGKLKK